MLVEYISNERVWKVAAAIIPVIAAIWKGATIFSTWFRSGKLLKLKYIEKEYGSYLDDQERSLIIKRIRDMTTSKILGVSNPKIKKRLIYVMNKSNLKLPGLWATNVGKYLVFNGVRFYFDTTDKNYKKRKKQSKLLALAYYFYSAMPIIVYFNQKSPFISLSVALSLSLILIILATFLSFSYPSDKQAMSLNGSLLKIDARNYRDK